jgi:hypothetical protein
MARNGDVMRSDRLKQVMQQIDSNFDERNAGFNRFSKFVVEAGQKGVVHVTKLDNGQYEVAPPAGAAALAGAPAAPSRPAREGQDGPREENGRRGRGRRGRGRERGPRERAEESAREPAPARARATDGALTLARAFQLMSQALGELRGPVPHEALRLRMVALHGREDALLDTGRFTRLLRQANDAEVADVRKVGDDDYEVSPHRTTSVPAIAAPAGSGAPAAPAPAAPTEEPAATVADAAPDAAARDNGQRLGVRFRRGSRGPIRPGEIPLIGVVQIEAPLAPEPVPAPVASDESAADAPAKRPARKRTPRKKAAAVAAGAPAGDGGESAAAAPKPRRPRTRAKKKAE